LWWRDYLGVFGDSALADINVCCPWLGLGVAVGSVGAKRIGQRKHSSAFGVGSVVFGGVVAAPAFVVVAPAFRETESGFDFGDFPC